MSERKQLTEFRDNRVKKIALITMIVLLMAAIGTIIGSADSFYSIRINYVFKDGTPAHDAYVATYRAGEQVDLTVVNPKISGFTPMTAPNGGSGAEQSVFNIASLDQNVTTTVYYVAGLTNYKVIYYKQNIYDDLYTRDNNVAEQYTNRYGYTGTNPVVLETESLFEGFTNLFHEPDAIAADGSTLFRVYYDRNYYTILFDLGDGGYGIDPIYAKYQTVYHISDPKRLGYIFKGWARTSADSSNGEYGEDWEYIDENGNTITEEQATANAFKFYDGEVPAGNQFFKAIWEQGTTSFSVVYWLEKPNSNNLEKTDIEAMGSIDEARALIAENYAVIAAKDVENVVSGTPVNLTTQIPKNDGQSIEAWDFFSYDLSENGDFPSMSVGLRSELNGKRKYYELNEDISSLQFGGKFEDDQEKTSIEVAGDGTTRINVYFDRVEFTLQFFYARQTADGTVYLTNSTKGFSGAGNINSTIGQKLQISLSADSGNQWMQSTDELPHIKQKYLDKGLEEKFITVGTDKFWYYEVKANYNDVMTDEWFIDALTPVTKKNTNGQEKCRFGSWAVEKFTKYYNDHLQTSKNYTIKGIYDRLGDDLMFADDRTNYKELHYLASWTNTDTRNPGNGWNYTENFVYNFTYNSYIEILDWENEYTDQELIDMGNYVDVITNGSIRYGLKAEFIVETYDSGSQYQSVSERDKNIRSNQTAAEITGFEFLGTDELKNRYGFTGYNPTSSWYAKNDKDANHHADVNFFYRRRVFTLKWRNGNRLEEEHNRSVKYGAPLNAVYKTSENGHEAGEYRYYYENPEYFNQDLREHYSFVGWYYTPYYYRMLNKDTATMPADDTTFYAKWDPKVIKVSFYPNYNDFYQGENRIGEEIPVNYGDFIPIDDIPADTNDSGTFRPKLEAPTEGAMFSGWYYLRGNTPVRFEPENIPVTALNKQAADEDNAKLELFAEWATNDIAKYYITYVEKDHPENEVAEPFLGRSFLWKTRTVNAKTGSELNEAHAWSEDGQNWWPTTNSHSLVIRANKMGGASPYDPNTFSFEYVQKRGVYYKVEYRDMSTHTELAPPKDEAYSTHGSVKEDSKYIPGYVVDEVSKTLTLTASTAETEAEQKAEELENNVITFYYNKNDTEYVYEVEYYKQNIENNDYFLYFTENREAAIAEEGDTTVEMQEIYGTHYARLIEDGGFTRVAGASKVIVTASDGTVTTSSLADDGYVVIAGDKKTTVKVFYDRNVYTYRYLYVDYHAERMYLDTPEDQRGDMWNGLIEAHDGDGSRKVDSVVAIPAPLDITYNNIPYTRIQNKEITLTIAPANESNPNVNTVKVYYKKFTERELTYKLSCENEGESGVRVDYDPITGDPLFGGLSMTMQTVDSYDGIAPVTFYNFNDATSDNSGNVEKFLHYHKYTFLGWFDNPDGTGTPLTTEETLTKDMLGLNGSLPARDATYYAVVHEEMVTTVFEMRCVEQELPVGEGDEAETQEDRDAAVIVGNGTTDNEGNLTGCYFHLTDPLDYAVGAPIPWNKVEGYSLSIEPKDNKVYKYEFAEWWEEDLVTHKLIRRKDWNSSGEWKPTVLTSQLDRKKDRHIIAVFKRREVNELPYTIDYKFIARTGDEQTFRINGVLDKDQLNEALTEPYITPDGDFRLTDEFIMTTAPYESNHGETLTWTDKQIVKTSFKGDPESETVDRIETTVTALSAPKKVYANYQTTPGGEYSRVEGKIGDSGKTNREMLKIRAADVDSEGKPFKYWEVRKTAGGAVVAKSYRTQFDLCLMDNYYISPVYGEEEQSDESLSITLTHLDNSRNRWTDENGNIADDGKTDCLYSDFEVAYLGLDDLIMDSTAYKVGMVFERCKTLNESEEFVASECDFESDPENLKDAIKTALSKNKTTASYNYDESDPTLKRNIQINALSNEGITNRNRVEVGKRYYNAKNSSGSYTNSPLVIKVYAYIIIDGEITLSNPEYICLRAEAQKDLAVGNMTVEND